MIKIVIVAIALIGSAIYGIDRLLTKLSQGVGVTKRGQGPPWVRASRRRLEQWPFYLELLLGVISPFLVASMIAMGMEGQSSLGWRGWVLAIASVGACSGAIVLAIWLWRGDPARFQVAQALVYVMWAAGGSAIIMALAGQFADPGTSSILLFLTAFVDYLRASKAKKLSNKIKLESRGGFA